MSNTFVAVSPGDGLRVVCSWGDTLATVQFGIDAPIALPSGALYPVVARQSDGDHWLLAQAQGEAVSYRVSRRDRTVTKGPEACGQDPVWVTPGHVFISRCKDYLLDGSPRPTVMGSQGFMGVNPDTLEVYPVDQYRNITIGPYTMNRYRDSADWVMGLDITRGRPEGVIAYRKYDQTFWQVTTAYSTPVGPVMAQLWDGSLVVGLNLTTPAVPSGCFIRSDQFTPISGPEPPPPVSDGDVPKFSKRVWWANMQMVATQYPDDPHPFGNAIIVVPPGHCDDVGALGYPMIATVDTYSAKYDNPTIAYFTHSSLPEVMEAEYNALKALPEKPVIFYLDSREWPAQRPAWMPINRSWLGVQCYRNPGESLNDFVATIEKLLTRLTKDWKLPIVLMAQFYDRNGQMPMDQVMEVQPYWAKWTEEFNVAGILAFSDMRPSGMVTWPQLDAKARQYVDRTLGRPNRYAYWQPSNIPMKDVLTNVLSQTPQNVFLSDLWKAYLLGSINVVQRVQDSPVLPVSLKKQILGGLPDGA